MKPLNNTSSPGSKDVAVLRVHCCNGGQLRHGLVAEIGDHARLRQLLHLGFRILDAQREHIFAGLVVLIIIVVGG